MGITGTVPAKVTIGELVITPVVRTTRFVDLAGSLVAAGGWLTVLTDSGEGQLDEFLVRCPKINFKVLVAVDVVSVFSKTHGELCEIGQNSPDISAFAELDMNGDPTGYYVASIRDIPYQISILMRVQNTGLAPVTFSQLFAKYTIKE
jgi:hypothetical protein